MKKRIISVLLLCCMALGLLPTTAFANNGGAKAIQLGTSGISGYDSTNSSYDYIHFVHGITAPSNGACWIQKPIWPMPGRATDFSSSPRRCLGQGSLVASNLIIRPRISNSSGRAAVRRTGVMTFTAEVSALRSKKAVLATRKSDALYGMYYDASDNILDGDKVFFLSAEEAENAAYGFTDDNARIANDGDKCGSVGGSVLLEDSKPGFCRDGQ